MDEGTEGRSQGGKEKEGRKRGMNGGRKEGMDNWDEGKYQDTSPSKIKLSSIHSYLRLQGQ